MSSFFKGLISVKKYALFSGFIFIGILGFIDYLSGHEIRISIFYIVPISLITWRSGRKYGILASVVSASVEAASDYYTGLSYSHPLILLWNVVFQTFFFMVVVFSLTALKNAYNREKNYARTDFLTGIYNRKGFFVLAERESERCRRYSHPLTIAYIDCDNFKQVNDLYGHDRGDAALKAIAAVLQINVRVNDISARLGGDEFVVLLPETNPEGARSVLEKIHGLLLKEMGRMHLPVTFSIGAAIFLKIPGSLGEILRTADKLMYSVKKYRKNSIQYEVFE